MRIRSAANGLKCLAGCGVQDLNPAKTGTVTKDAAQRQQGILSVAQYDNEKRLLRCVVIVKSHKHIPSRGQDEEHSYPETRCNRSSVYRFAETAALLILQ